MSRGAIGWDRVAPDAAVVLRGLDEREANLVGLAHVLGDLPSPDVGVLARWRDTMAEPGSTVTLHRFASTLWVTDRTASAPRRGPVPASPDTRLTSPRSWLACWEGPDDRAA